MSAWIVDKAVIDLLVEASFRSEVPLKAPLTQDALGALLWKENHRSVNYRYQERTRTPHYRHESQRPAHGGAGELHGTITTLAQDPVFTLKQLACYEYQSCEHPTWPKSRAYYTMQALKAAILTSLGMTYKAAMNAAAQAPWGIFYP